MNTLGPQLFNRDFFLQVGNLQITARGVDEAASAPCLRVTFDIEKTSDQHPNTAKIVLYNVSETHRKLLQQRLPVVITAGYIDNMSQLFVGKIKVVTHVHEYVDWISTVEVADSLEALSTARINKSYKAGTPLMTILMDCVQALVAEGIGLGDSSVAALGADFCDGSKTLKKGRVCHGQVQVVLNQLLISSGYRWSIQDGQFQILLPKQPTFETVVVLNSGTGLLGMPEVGENNVVSFKSLLNGAIKPGRRVMLDSQSVKGAFKIEKARYNGDTWGNDWTVEAEARAA